MKNSLMIFLSLMISTNTFSSELNLDYSSMVKNAKACRKTFQGCSAQQELEIAEFEGRVLNSYELNKYLNDDGKGNAQKSYFIPLSLTNQELLTLAAATSLGVIAFHNDQEIMDTVQRHRSNVTEPIAKVGDFLGTTALLPIAAGSYFLGVYYKDNRLKQVGLFTVGASIAQSIITTAVKEIAGRDRPRVGNGPYVFSDPKGKSFYSGHTAEAFTIATVFAEMYKEDYPVVPWVAYGLASVTAYARMSDNAHWASDVIIGAVAGHLITKLALSAMKGNPDGRGGFDIIPGYDPKTGTFSIYANWVPKEKDQPLRCSKMKDGTAKIDACLAEAFDRAAKHK